MPITAAKIREIARQNPQTPEEEAEAIRKAKKDLSVRAMLPLNVFETSMKDMLISTPDFGLTSLVRELSFENYTRALLNDMAERWRELQARAEKARKTLGEDWPVDFHVEQTELVIKLLQTIDKERLDALARLLGPPKATPGRPRKRHARSADELKELEEKVRRVEEMAKNRKHMTLKRAASEVFQQPDLESAYMAYWRATQELAGK